MATIHLLRMIGCGNANKAKVNGHKMIQTILCILSTLQFACGEQNDDNHESQVDATVTNDLDWLEGFSSVGPYLAALFLLIFVLHFLIQPDWMMHSLMRQYIDEGSPVVGSVLDCEDKENKPGVYLVEVCYQTQEHKYADNPSMRFRFPGAYDTKNFVRRFEFHRSIPLGSSVPVLLPRGSLFPRSGCPREVVEHMLQELHERQTRRNLILGFGITSAVVIIALAIRQILAMEDPEHKHGAWVALLGTLVLVEALAFLFCADQFMKKKCRTFDAARPMVNAAEQRQRLAHKAQNEQKTVAPFSIPLNEFAGHARATERNR